MFPKYSYSEIARRTVLITIVSILTAFAAFLVYYALKLLLVIFLGILLATLFRAGSNLISRKFKVSAKITLPFVIVLFFGITIGSIWIILPQISAESDAMQTALSDALMKLKAELATRNWGQKFSSQIENDPHKYLESEKTMGYLKGFLSDSMTVLINGFLLVIIGLFFAANPSEYKSGIIGLFSKSRQAQVKILFDNLSKTLKLWLVAKFLSMILLGGLTYIGLLFLGVPLALILAVIVAIMAFIPTIGAYLAILPTALVALTVSESMVLYVLILYFIIQMLETYILTPIIYKRIIKIPPALMLIFQVLMGMLAGGLGLLLAAPILAVLIVGINTFRNFSSAKNIETSV